MRYRYWMILAASLTTTFTVVAADMKKDVSFSLAPITVTAEKRPADVQDVASSISVFNKELLSLALTDSIGEVAKISPNFSYYSVGSRRTALFYMRGLGSSGPNKPAVGFFVDDVYYPKTGLSDISLSGIQRAEVLRGPQSTLYGRNTAGGAISIVTPTPSAERAGKLAVEGGDYSHFKTSLGLSGPFSDSGNLFYSIDGSYFSRNGYTHNDFLGEDADDIEHLSGRMKLRWIPSDELDISLSIYADRDRDGGYPLTTLENVINSPYHVEHNQAGAHSRKMQIYSLNALYKAPAFDVLSVTAFRNWNNRDKYDQDFSRADIVSLYDTDSLHGFSQEFRLTSRDASPSSWLTGLYLYHNSENDDNFKSFGANAGIYGAPAGMLDTSLLGVQTRGIAMFGRYAYDITERFHSMAGLRFEHQEKDATGRQFFSMGGWPAGPQALFDAEQDYDEFMPEASLAYDFSTDVMSYVRVARGFREGGFNNGESGAQATYDPERVWNYETGIKSSWLDNRLTLNLSAFIMEIKNQQVIQFKPGGYGFSFKNAGESENKGAEIELAARLLDWLELRGGFGYVDAQFESFSDPALSADYSGNTIPFVPGYNYHASINCRKETVSDIIASITLGVTGAGKTYWDEANQIETGGYALINARIGLAYRRYEFSLFGRNLGDKEYPSAVYAFPNSTPLAQPGDPRTIGAMLSCEL